MTISVKALRSLRRAELREVRVEDVAAEREERDAALDEGRPRCRADCIDAPRPCPWVGCKHNLFLDVTPVGSLLFNLGADDVSLLTEMSETCALDVADRGGVTLEEVGAYMRLTRERVRQVEMRGLLALKKAVDPDEGPETT